MRFLLIGRTEEFFYSLPPEVRKQIDEEQNQFLKKCSQEGKLIAAWNLVGKKKTVSIWEVNTAEEGEQLFKEFPGCHYVYFKIYPITEMKL